MQNKITNKIPLFILSVVFITVPISVVNAIDDFANLSIVLDKSTFFDPEIITFDLKLKSTATTTTINAVDSRLVFNPENLELLSANTSSLMCNFFIYETINNEEGIYQMMCGTNQTSTTSDKIVTLTFKKIKAGFTTINISSDSQVLLNDGFGTKLPVIGETHNIFIFK